MPAPACIFCHALAATDDRTTLVLHRTEHAFLILNAYPYASGHLMAVPNRHVGEIGSATPEELVEVMRLVQRSVDALRREYGPEGFNIGMNEGRVAGAGIPGHVHMHVVPRWAGDTNFMTTLAATRVIPEDIQDTYRLARQYWPGSTSS